MPLPHEPSAVVSNGRRLDRPSTKEIVRRLKRYIVGDVHTALRADFATLTRA
jgi:hypothetical protein